VVPLHINGSDHSVLVNRGWIPLAESTPEARRAFDMAGDVTIEGIAYRSQTRPDTYFAATDPTPSPPETRLDAWFRVDIARIAQQLDEPLLPIFIVQSPDEPMANALPLRQETTDLGEGPHLGYAMQWFSFAIVLVVLYAVFLWQQAGNRQPNTNTQELEKPI
jgi:surfeit locus 1 family protein